MEVTQRNYRFPEQGEDKKVGRVKKGFTPRKLTKLALLVFIAYLIFSFSQGFYQAYQLKKDIQDLEKEVAELRKQEQKLQEELEYMQSPEAVEKFGREKLGLVKPGEIVIMQAKEAP